MDDRAHRDRRPDDPEPADFDTRPLLVVSIALLVIGFVMDATPLTTLATLAIAVMVPSADSFPARLRPPGPAHQTRPNRPRRPALPTQPSGAPTSASRRAA